MAKKVTKKAPKGISTTGQVQVTIGVTPPGPKNFTSCRIDVGAEVPLGRTIADTVKGVVAELVDTLEKEAVHACAAMDKVILDVEKNRRS